MNKPQPELSWELADIRDPMIFSLVLYEEPSLFLEIMNLFYPEEGLQRIREMKIGLADVLHGSRSDPAFKAIAETENEEVTLWLDYIRELNEEKEDDYRGHSLKEEQKKEGKTLNLTFCRSDPFQCGRPVMRLLLRSEDLCPDEQKHWVIEGVLVSLHEETEAEDPNQQKLIRYLQEGVAEGELCTKIEKTVHKVRENEEWRMLYLEEKAYRDYMTQNT